MRARVDTFRSLLFVPGSRPERIEKALAAGADAVCIDLEDAVPPQDKAQARAAVLAWLQARPEGGPALGVRFNAVSSIEGWRDAVAFADAGVRPDFLMVPKVGEAAELSLLGGVLADAPALWPIVESAVGLDNAYAIAGAPGVTGVLFGGADMSADLGSTMEWEALAYARGRLAAACAGAGVQLLDVPHLDIKDEADLVASTARSKALGFTGRACIHPVQVAPVNAVHTPTAAEIERAQRVVAALEAASGGAALLDGKLIELPVIRAANRVLARAETGDK
jgi:citrate lyase subunit beta/citryl-CoA lyase/(S)-citramalyl-CoA lyase